MGGVISVTLTLVALLQSIIIRLVILYALAYQVEWASVLTLVR